MSYVTSQLLGLRVLIVDSHEDSLLLATIALECLRVNVLAVKSAKQALRALPTFQPEILISELCLPEEDGYSLMRKVRAYLDCRKQQIPAISLTTQVHEEAKSLAFDAGFCRHIAKPYYFETLVEAVVELSESDAFPFNAYQYCA